MTELDDEVVPEVVDHVLDGTGHCSNVASGWHILYVWQNRLHSLSRFHVSMPVSLE